MPIDAKQVTWDAPDPRAVQWDDDRKGKPSAAERVGMGLADPIQGGAQLLTKMLPSSVVEAGNALNNWLADKTGLVGRLPAGGVDQQTREREQAYQSRRGDAGIDWLRLAGNVASPANLALGAAVPARMATLGGRMAAGAAGGAAAAGLAPVTDGDYGESKAQQIGIGALSGAALPAAMGAVSRVISPRASTNPALAALKAEGVRPTVGQSLGGMANRVEEKAISLPVVGDAIRGARARAEADLNRAVANRALAPIGKDVPEGVVGRELVAAVQRELGGAYDNALTGVTVAADQQFNAAIGNLRRMVSTGSINPAAAQTFSRIIKGDVLGKFKGRQAVTGETLKQIESDLGQQIARFGQSADPDQRLIGDALKEAQSQLRQLVGRANPAVAKEIKAINRGYANFKRLERAASYVGAEDGTFTASHLQSAVRALDKSRDKGRFARGKAQMQDLSDPAKSVLGSKVPNSGTADRMLNLPLALGAAAYEPMTLAAPALGALAYTPWGQTLLRGAVSARPAAAQPVAGMLNQAAPMLAPAGGLLGLEFMQ